MSAAPLSVSVRAIADVVCEARGIPRSLLMSYRRGAALAEARFIIMWLASRHTGKTLSDIGRILGRDHSTVMHGLATIDERRAANPDLAAEIDQFEARIVAIAEAVQFGGPPIPPNVDAYDVAQRIIETPHGAIRVSVIDIEALAAAVIAAVSLRNDVLALLTAETPEAAAAAINTLIDHVATGPKEAATHV